MYPYVIPFSGAALARNPALSSAVGYAPQRVGGTTIEWEQPAKMLPLDPAARDVILRVESRFESRLAQLQRDAAHLPSRLRSLLWLECSEPVMNQAGYDIGDLSWLPGLLRASLPQQPRAESLAAVVNA
jgi:hypothetical protein